MAIYSVPVSFTSEPTTDMLESIISALGPEHSASDWAQQVGVDSAGVSVHGYLCKFLVVVSDPNVIDVGIPNPTGERVAQSLLASALHDAGQNAKSASIDAEAIVEVQ